MKIKNVVGYEGKYAISEDGRVFNLIRGIEMKQHDIDGYMCVKFRVNNEIKNYRVHRLVYAAFKGRIIDNLVIDHIDGNKKNNNIENLRQLPNRENCNLGIQEKRKDKLPRGVRRFNKDNMFGAEIGIEKERYYLGTFKTPEEASDAYQSALRNWLDKKIKPQKRDRSVKLCKTCGKVKPISEFYYIQGHGYSWYCKDCSKEYSRNRRADKS